jgi:disulfide oxidoreductase YuzD
MPLNFKAFLESYKMEDQTFSYKGGTYSVPKMVSFAKKNKKLQKIPINLLTHNLKTSNPRDPEFIERVQQTNLIYPIIVVKYPNGLFVADGIHRLYKAKSRKNETIKGYIIDHSELDTLKL